MEMPYLHLFAVSGCAEIFIQRNLWKPGVSLPPLVQSQNQRCTLLQIQISWCHACQTEVFKPMDINGW